ncbi:MAG: hypothetical protein ACI4SM_00575 [Candidatus Gastranaerophilaceae bacterium]
MKKKAFTLVEISVVLFLVLLTVAIVVPNLVEDNKKLNVISQWKHVYRNIEYVFLAVKAQSNDIDVNTFKLAKNDEQREKFLYDLLNPYFRMQDSVDVKDYRVKFLNGKDVKPDDIYYITNLHTTSGGNIIGLKWLNVSKTKKNFKSPVAILSYDLNGYKKPNKWGYDIFGVNIYVDKLEPIGKTLDENMLKYDCSKKGKGLSCSYYYYIYGGKLN